MKTTKKTRKTKTRGKTTILSSTLPWMSTLAQLAAESRADGSSGLRELCASAKFDLRPKMSLQKHLADDEAPQVFSKKHAA